MWSAHAASLLAGMRPELEIMNMVWVHDIKKPPRIIEFYYARRMFYQKNIGKPYPYLHN